MSKKIYQNIDELVFKGINQLKNHQQYNQLLQKIEGVSEDIQKYVYQGISYSISFFPIMILFVVFIFNSGVRGRISEKETVIEEIKKNIKLKNKITSVNSQLLGTIAINDENALKNKLSQVTRNYKLKNKSLSVLEVESEEKRGIIQAKGTILFEQLSTPKLIGVLTEFLVKEKAQIESLKVNKTKDKLKGEFSFSHFGKGKPAQ